LLRLATLLTSGGFAVIVRVRTSSDPSRAMTRIGRGRRSRTLRAHVLVAEKLAGWTYELHDVCWPSDIQVILDYVEVCTEEPCSVTFYKSFLAGVSFVEACGEVPPEQRYSGSPASRNLIEELRVVQASPSRTKKKAPLLPVILLVSLELLVVSNEAPLYDRGYAWYRLVRTWAALRHDDALHVDVASLSLTDALDGTLLQTKTTGIGKTSSEARFTLSRKAFVSQPDWLPLAVCPFRCPTNQGMAYLIVPLNMRTRRLAPGHAFRIRGFQYLWSPKKREIIGCLTHPRLCAWHVPMRPLRSIPTATFFSAGPRFWARARKALIASDGSYRPVSCT
jgi:hypothetical protein